MNYSATYVRTLRAWRSDARLYRVSPPITFRDWTNDCDETTDYVIVSATSLNTLGGPVISMFNSDPETYIFPADASGEALNMLEIYPGSFQGSMDHVKALNLAGYDVDLPAPSPVTRHDAPAFYGHAWPSPSPADRFRGPWATFSN